MPQSVTFIVDGEQITISAADAARIVDTLRPRPDTEAHTAAAKIERATRDGESNAIELDSIEDDEVLAVLASFDETDGLRGALARLDRALREKIEREQR
jgi:hypothetical protein